jgi:hypothetical protein
VQILFIEVSRGAPRVSKSASASITHFSIAKTLISGGILSAKASKFNQVQGVDSRSGLPRGIAGLVVDERGMASVGAIDIL